LLRHGMSGLPRGRRTAKRDRRARSGKAPPKIEPEENQKFTLPAFFPDRLTLSNVNVRMASQPEDLIIEGLNLELNPKHAGELRIAKLQLASGKSWSGVTAQTTYENRNLFLRNLVLDEQTKLDVVNIDASQIGSNQLAVGVKGTVAGGKIDTTMSLGAKEDSMETTIDLNVADTSLDTVRKYLQPAAAAQNEDPRQQSRTRRKRLQRKAQTPRARRRSALRVRSRPASMATCGIYRSNSRAEPTSRTRGTALSEVASRISKPPA
jgi:hypothetical protein